MRFNFDQSKIFSSGKGLTLYQTIPTFNENIVEKGENAGNQHFLLFPQCFLSFQKQISVFQSHLFCSLQTLSIWTSPKFCCPQQRLIDQMVFNLSPDDKVLDQSKLEQSADDILQGI